MQTTKQSLSFQAQKNLTGSKLSYDNRTPIKYVEVIFVILNNNELNAEILRKAFEGADLGVVCVRGKGFIESDDDILNADLSDTVYLGQKIKIDRVNYAYYPIYKSIPYKTVEQESDKLFVGQTKVYQQGKSGSTEYIYKDKYVNGELISHKCTKQQVLTYPTDNIIVKGTKNVDVINKSYNNKTNYLIKTKYDSKDFKLPKIKLSDKDRDMLERIVTGEFGSSYIGSCLIAQSIKCAIVYDRYTSVSAVIKGMGYVGSTANRSQNAVNAVKYIFDDNNLAVRHRLFYMCTKDYYDSTPGNFHSTQNFILQYENVLFFDRW